ncbi:Uncharacterised protein [Clostridioides difficile]|nr:Uncharacterised protein [Clostridioides difficile]
MPSVLVKIFIRDESTILIASGYLQIIAVSQIFSNIYYKYERSIDMLENFKQLFKFNSLFLGKDSLFKREF